MKKERLYWIDGLRGLACMLIFTHHFLVSFFPSTFNANMDTLRMTGGLDAKWANSPLSVFICGNFWVCVFCLVSGLVLSYQIYNAKEERDISDALLKRYPRLCFPLAAVSFITWIMMQFFMFPTAEVLKLSTSSWITSAYGTKMSFGKFLFTAFFSTWVSGDSSLSPAYWLMTVFLTCSFVVYALAIMSKNKKYPVMLLFAAMTIFYLIYDQSLNLAFVFGVILSYRMCYMKRTKIGKYFGIVFVLAGLFLGGYPTEAYPTGWYLWLGVNISQHFVPVAVFFHVMGAMLLVWGIYLLQPLCALLSTKLFRFLGKISYAVFLIHCPVIFSWSCFIFLKVYHACGRYQVSAAVSFVTSTILLLILSYYFNKYVESAIGKGINKAVSLIQKKESTVQETD